MKKDWRAGLLGIAGMLCSTCGFLIDLPSDPPIETCPAYENQILEEQMRPAIRFSCEVNRSSVESLFSVEDGSGALSGDFRWEGNEVSFHAQPPLVPGRRYVFSFFGAFTDLEGGRYLVHSILPFYYQVEKENAPRAAGSDPESGQIISCHTAIRLVFSEAIDPDTEARGFSIEPQTPYDSEWEAGGRELLVRPRDRWQHCCCYKFRITTELHDTAGIPLAEAGEFVFWVQEDTEAPAVVSVEPAYNDPQRLFPKTGRTTQQELGLMEVLRIEFSEAMETTNPFAVLTLQPQTAVQILWIDAATLVVIPADRWIPNTEYHCYLQSDAVDVAGNSIDTSQPIPFFTEPGWISAVTVFENDGVDLQLEEYSTVSALEVHPYPLITESDYLVSFVFDNAQFDSNVEKARAREAISLRCVFPDSGVSDPEIRSLLWIGDQRLDITFSGFTASTVCQRIYYILRIDGGAGGLSTDEGLRLSQDLEQLLTTAVP